MIRPKRKIRSIDQLNREAYERRRPEVLEQFVAGMHHTSKVVAWGTVLVELKGVETRQAAVLVHNSIYDQIWAWTYIEKRKRVENVSPSSFER